MAELTNDMKASFDRIIAIGEYGTQFWWWNKTSQKFEYGLPLVSGGEYGGDTETFEAPEMDLDYVPKISGRTTLDDITLTSNYTKDRYKRWLQILSNTDIQAYLEVYSDGSASMYSGTAGRPTIQGGDVRQIETTIAPTNMIWIDDITNVTDVEDESTVEAINNMLNPTTPFVSGFAIPFDDTTIPSQREKFFNGTKSTQSVSYGI